MVFGECRRAFLWRCILMNTSLVRACQAGWAGRSRRARLIPRWVIHIWTVRCRNIGTIIIAYGLPMIMTFRSRWVSQHNLRVLVPDAVTSPVNFHDMVLEDLRATPDFWTLQIVPAEVTSLRRYWPSVVFATMHKCDNDMEGLRRP